MALGLSTIHRKLNTFWIGFVGRVHLLTPERQRARWALKALACFLIIVPMGAIVSTIQTADAASLKVTGTVVVPIDLDPMHIRRGTDGNYVVTGTLVDLSTDAVLPAAAIGLDPSGKVLWRYASPVFDPQKYPATSQSYANSVEMTDGSIFLCGRVFNVPQVGAKKMALLLTHLDSKGNLLKEQIIPLRDRHIQSNGKCAKWGDGLVILGDYGEHIDAAPAATAYLWRMDKNGELIWEKNFDQGGRVIISDDSLYVLSESYFGPRIENAAPGTDFGDITVTRISPQGEQEFVRKIPGLLGQWGHIADQAIPQKGSDIYLIGVTKPIVYSESLTKRVVVRLNSKLHEISRVAIDAIPRISMTGLISQPDGSLFYYGMVGKRFFSNSPIMGVAYSNADFTQQAILQLDIKDFDEAPKITVAASAGVTDHFVTASRLFLKDFFDSKGAINPVVENKFPPSTSPGHYLVVQFVRVTH